MKTKTRTWAYGSTLRGKVIEVNIGRNDAFPVHLVQDQKGEGHVLVGNAADATAKEGDHGTLTFTKGGPTGGYWKFEKDKKRNGL